MIFLSQQMLNVAHSVNPLGLPALTSSKVCFGVEVETVKDVEMPVAGSE